MRVAIAEDSGLIREALGVLLTTIGVQVTASVPTGTELLAAVREAPPDVAIVDMRMPPTRTNEGLLTARALRDAHPSMGILVVTAHDDDPFAADLFAGGADGIGYMRKDNITNRQALRDALERLRDGQPVIDSHIAARLLAGYPQSHRLLGLSDRERRILELMAQGLSNSGISQQVHLSPKTVESHIASIFTKLGLRMEPTENRRVLAVLAWLEAARHS
ncbi:DNA-binding response regulator [Frankia sp. CcI49]|uniref:response regulator transcription factor n=1 Tax=unclassified Frankia TaxID=2632575 RepID=UPI0006CA3E78|nr:MULTISPECIES: response regulator transcription factor [unclassified Frankia]KPM50683.1 LuxR family transcriptional regulator [Frankia sp. R43]ONH54081.1 DNA-binding response regulator [Frankia sp. CcI49]